MLKSLFLVFIFYILIINSYEIKINYLSNINYTNYECGGKIIFNDTTIYPPCKSINDASNRSQHIIRDNNFNSSIVFYLIKNDDGKELVINDSNYFYLLDFFENIEISVVNENLEKLDWNKSKVIIQQSEPTFICLTNEKSQNNNKNQSITIEGFQINNWNDFYFFVSYSNKVDTVIFNNNKFYNSRLISFLSTPYIPHNMDTKSLDLHYVNKMIINNCIFENTYNLSCYLSSKSAILKNVQFIGNNDSLIKGNTENLLIDNCKFINNTIGNGERVIHIKNKNGTVKIINSQFINNDITKFLIAGDNQIYGIMHVYMSNCTFSDNIFRKYSDSKEEIPLFLYLSQKDSWSLEIKDTIIQRKFSENMLDSGYFFHSDPASGSINFSNLNIINYSFMVLISATKTNITIINTPSFDKSLVVGNNNTIHLIDYLNNNNNNNKVKITIITVTTVSIFIIISIIILIVVKKNKNIIKSFIIYNKKNNKNNNNKNDKIDNSNIYVLDTSSMGTAACDNVTVKSESTNITENSKKSTVEN